MSVQKKASRKLSNTTGRLPGLKNLPKFSVVKAPSRVVKAK